MIIKDFQLINSINSELFQSFLIYGPNEGLIRENIDIVYKNFTQRTDCEKININGKQLDESVSILKDEISTISLFNEKKFIVLDSPKEKHVSIIEDSLSLDFKNTCMVVKQDNLTKSSSIRKLYETSKNHFCLACYDDDIKAISSLLEKFQKMHNIIFDSDVKSFLLNNLSNDRMVIKNELEKILLSLSKNEKKVDIEKLRYILHDSAYTDFQQINKSILFGNIEKGSKSLEKLFNLGTNPVAILKSFNNYIMRIRLTQVELSKGKQFDEAIKVLKPPVFWKEKSDFRRHCLMWPANVIENIINEVLSSEIKCITNNVIAKEQCEKTLFEISSAARKYSRN
tara:strand:- start:1265 stop:2287 length:1023 start_codon:yes stop_codon:yes gene_type:complete